MALMSSEQPTKERLPRNFLRMVTLDGEVVPIERKTADDDRDPAS